MEMRGSRLFTATLVI